MKTRINNGQFANLQGLVMRESLPYQYDIISGKTSISGYSPVFDNLKKAAAGTREKYVGFVFQDSDAYKWLESAGYALSIKPDAELTARVEHFVDLMDAAQGADGYINTYFMIDERERKYTDLQNSHELYCAGHFFEAAVAVYKSIRNEKVLKIAKKWADGLVKRFITDKAPGYDGHQEVELALIKLYDLTGEAQYLKLARHFLDERGKMPSYFAEEKKKRGGEQFFNGWTKDERELTDKDLEYFQAHKEVWKQDEAAGHAVRLVYMLCAMVDTAKRYNDKEKLEAAKKLYKNITEKKMYITGGIGSTAIGEAFTGEYDLPPDTAYNETCASIGLAFVCKRLLECEINSGYADILELEVYNGIISGVSQDGKKYFYVNPVLCEPDTETPVKNHVKNVRQDWYTCACCPPNLTRFVLSLGDYIYTVKDGCIYNHLFIGSETAVKTDNGEMRIKLSANYPYSRRIMYEAEGDGCFKLGIRVPAYVKAASFKHNGKTINPEIKDGYAVTGIKGGDIIEAEFDFAPARVYTNSKVRANIGMTAIKYGPLVMCLEHSDNGGKLKNLYLPKASALMLSGEDTGKPGDALIVTAKGKEIYYDTDKLYFETADIEEKEVTLKFIPYREWANRGEGEMSVFVREV